jgi:hypothetical protein
LWKIAIPCAIAHRRTIVRHAGRAAAELLVGRMIGGTSEDRAVTKIMEELACLGFQPRAKTV